MKKTLFTILAVASLAVAFVSCEKPDDPQKETYKIEYNAPSGLIGIGKEASFTDLSLSVSERLWTFEDGTPATSSNASVTVIFTSAGTKKVTLKDTFTDGSSLTETFNVTVVEPIDGAIAVEAENLTPMGCIRLGAATKFIIDGLKGDPDKYEWSFEGGNPATSTEAQPSVTFEKGNRNGIKVTCKVSRSGDNASETFEGSWIVGNYPVNRTLPEYKYDAYGFEMDKPSIAVNIAPAGSTSRKDHFDDWCSIADEGADGTAHSLMISYAEANLEKTTQITWDRNWMCNGRMQAGKWYKISFWWKPVFNGDPEYVYLGYTYANQLKDDYTNKFFNLTSSTDWEVFYPGETFMATTTKTKIVEDFTYANGLTNKIGEEGSEQFISDWIFHEKIFLCPENLDGAELDHLNPYMYLNVNTPQSPNLKALYIDEMWFDLVEEYEGEE